MENSGASENIRNLREWAPLADLLSKIPVKLQKGIFYQDVNITCVDALPEFIALGTNVGVVFWFNRTSGDLQKLRCEQSKSITCLKIISSVEYMVAAGMESGQVNIFQIQKEHPPDLNLVAPITKARPIERYTVKDLNRDAITALEWSKNGMKLFSGDRQGRVVLTEFDFVAHISKSIEILNEAYTIVQMGFIHPWLLVSTVYRTIVCKRDMPGMPPSAEASSWRVSQVGKKDRKILSKSGAVFTGTNRAPTIVCSRPGFRFWLADTEGNVSHTFLLKDAVQHPSYEVPILNPGPITSVLNGAKSSNFGPCYNYNNSHILTHNDHTIFIVNLEKLKIEATVRRIRRIQYLAISGWEIFVVEGGGSLIRISITAEKINGGRFGHVVYNANYVGGAACASRNYIPEVPIEFETEDEAITNADECFELPPIEQIHLDTPLHTNSAASRQDRLLLEHSRRVEVYEKINELDYDDSILFKTASQKLKKKKPKINGIVEVGQQAMPHEEQTARFATVNGTSSCQTSEEKANRISPEHNREAEDELQSISIRPVSPADNTVTVPHSNEHESDPSSDSIPPKPENESVASACMMEASFCNGDGTSPFVASPNYSQTDDMQLKERGLVAALNLDEVKLGPVKLDDKHKQKQMPPPLPDFSYRINAPQFNIDDSDLRPLSVTKKIHFLNDDEQRNLGEPTANRRSNSISESDREYLNRLSRRNDHLPTTTASMTQSLHFVPAKISPDVPVVKKLPDYMHLPNLWNARIERADDNLSGLATNIGDSSGSGSGSSEWEFL